ncbi:MAG: phosphoribosylanthranilate isomerase [Actinomycetota bacterium]|nr:phosphoribosylanthranilate isomerase [Actinomycetota bacterium]
MVRVKICGITNLEDALLAVKLGADALGFVFAESPRCIEPQVAAEIIKAIPPFVSRVGIFVDEDETWVKTVATICGLDILQFHGSESASYCMQFERKVIKAFRIKQFSDLDIFPGYRAVDAFLLDTFVEGRCGGTGKTFDWRIARKAKEFGKPIILSGGLNPDNVAEAIRLVKPYAVDVSSGVEKEPGKKDPDKLRAFFENVRSWESLSK